MSVVQKLMLNALAVGNEANCNFQQLYTVPNLQILGASLSLISLTGAVPGPTAALLLPLVGWFTDRGSNPNRRKMITVMLSMVLLLAGVSCVVLGNVLHLQSYSDLIPVSKNASDLLEQGDNVTTWSMINLSINQDILQPASNITDDIHEGPPLKAGLGVLGFILLNLGFDFTNAFVKSWVLTCSPRTEQTFVLMLGTAVGSAGGLCTSSLAVVDLHVEFFGLEGMGLTIQVIVQALIVLSLVLAGSALTIVVGFHQLQSQTSILREGNSDEGEVQPKDADHSETSDPDESETRLLLSHDSLELPAEERYHQGVHKMYRFGQNQTLGSVDCETSSVTTVDCSSVSSAPGSPAEECRMPLFRNCASFDRRADTVQLSRAPSGYGTGSEQKTDRVKDSCTSVPRGSHDSRVSGAGQKNFKRKVFFICASLYFSAGLLNMYTMMSTDYVGKTIYGGDPDAESGSDSLRDYQTGVRFGSLGFVVYYVSYLLASVCHKRVHELLGYKQEYTLVELSTSACMATLALTTRIEVYFVLCVLAGFQRASYFVVPYAATNDLLQAQAQKSRQDGAAKLGLYMSVVAGTVPLAYSTIFPCVGPLTDAIGVASTPMWLGAACGCVSTVFFLTVGDL